MAVDRTALQNSRNRALVYLAQLQRPDGGFDSFSSPSKQRFKKTFTYQTNFVPAVMLAALSDMGAPGGQLMVERLAGFVQAQAGPGWSFNYWAADSPERQRQPYPDDLDDTACALVGLYRFRPELIGPDVLAAFVKLLLAAETRVGGPYRTWLVPDDPEHQWSDVDLAVNANIAYLLSLVSQPLPNITKLMGQAIAENKLVSPYYVSPHVLVYYLARAYQGPEHRKLQRTARTLSAQDTQPTPLQTALLLSALVRLGEKRVARLAERLLAAQQADGSWPAEAFCLDPARDKHTYYHGSESLTTALALEALELYGQSAMPHNDPGQPVIKKPAAIRAYTTFRSRVTALNRRHWQLLRPELSNSGLEFMQRLASATINPEIVALPKAFNEALRVPLAKTYEPALHQLGLASLYGWTAYTILDDFLDDEGKTELLPVATAALRHCLEAFMAALPGDQAFHDFVCRSFDAIDGANAWELAHCRFQRQGDQLFIGALPDYSVPAILAERSLGHCLAPLAVVRLKGIGVESKLFWHVRQALIHYLAAKQLNDDAHDWQTDMKNGHITYVVARLLNDAGIKPGPHAWEALLPVVREQFWYKTLPVICHDITVQTALSRQHLNSLSELKQRHVLTRLLDAIDTSVAETLATQSQTRTFLSHYKTHATASV